MWSCGPIVHFRDDQEVWVAGQHADLHDPKVLQHSAQRTVERQPPAASAVGRSDSCVCGAAHIFDREEGQESDGEEGSSWQRGDQRKNKRQEGKVG